MKVITTVYTGNGKKQPFVYVDIDGEVWQYLPGAREWRVKCEECKRFVNPDLLFAACTPGGHG